MTLKEARDEMYRLQSLVRKLEEKDRDKHREAARKFVGKCYKSPAGEILKIIGIPRTYLYMHGDEYNEYQFPAVFLQYPKMPKERCIRDELDEFAPCYCDTVYLNIEVGAPARRVGRDLVWYEELTPEEFDVEFDKCMAHFKEQIKV